MGRKVRWLKACSGARASLVRNRGALVQPTARLDEVGVEMVSEVEHPGADVARETHELVDGAVGVHGARQELTHALTADGDAIIVDSSERQPRRGVLLVIRCKPGGLAR